MNTLTVKYNGNNGHLIAELLRKFHFVKDGSIDETNIMQTEIINPATKPNIEDFAEIWADKPKTLKEIREKAWNWK